MVITYLGQEFFKVQFGDLTLAFNPISKESKLEGARFGADIALVSMRGADYDGVEQVSFAGREPFVINGPGEYEVKSIFIKGFASPGGGPNPGERASPNPDGRSDKHNNTIYTVSLENMNLCFLGALGSKELGAETKSALGDIDVLFVPIGGEEVLTSVEAAKLAVSLEPRLIIPMHYGKGVQGEAALKSFLKEIGAEGAVPQEKLTLKKKDLEGKEGEVAVLVPAS